MKKFFIAAFILLMAACSNADYSDKVNKEAYNRIEVGMSYDDAVFHLGGLEGEKITNGAKGAMYEWKNKSSNPTYTITLMVADGKVESKFDKEEPAN